MLICLICALKGYVAVLAVISEPVSFDTFCNHCDSVGHYCDNHSHRNGIWQ